MTSRFAHLVSPGHSDPEGLGILNIRPENREVRVQVILDEHASALIQFHGRAAQHALVASIVGDEKAVLKIQKTIESARLETDSTLSKAPSQFQAQILNPGFANVRDVIECDRTGGTGPAGISLMIVGKNCELPSREKLGLAAVIL